MRRTAQLALFCLWPVLGVISAVPRADAEEAVPKLVDVFTSGEEGYHTFRIPALIATPKGTLLAFCEGRKTGRGDHGDLDMVVKRSTDGGQTWGPLQLVYEEGGDAKITIGNPCPVVDQTTGVIWLPFNRDNDAVLITSSSDDGRTWAKPRDITADVKRPGWTWYAMGPGNGIQLTRGQHRGRLVIPCDHRVQSEGKLSRSHTIYSDDHGKTWRLGESTEQAMNECAVVELADGRLLLNMRSYRGKACRAEAVSSDGGHSWSACADNETLIEPVCQGSLIRHTWPRGNEPGRLLFSNPASAKGRMQLTIRASHDDGRTWPVSRVLYAGSAAYSCLAVLPNGTPGILFERDNYAKISFAELGPKWLMEGK